MDALVFIDTNILLDFYRYPQGSTVLSILNHIDKNHSILITGNQIEMEFKKNRQKVILESISSLSGPKWDSFKIPVILSDDKAVTQIDKSKKSIISNTKKLKDKIDKLLRNPARNDQVYKTLKGLFNNKSAYNLGRHNDLRFDIRELAKKRFILGYPPRKDKDTSIGDAINWEWIVHCAKTAKKNVIIVSRDTDYGHFYNNESIINDWLAEEFKERVGKGKKVILTKRLTWALKEVSVKVKDKDIQEEENLIITTETIVKENIEQSTNKSTSGKEFDDIIRELLT